MTVAEIKEYIDFKIKYYSEQEPYKITSNEIVRQEFEEIKSMLDELEDRPKAKWVKTQVGYYDDDYGYECSNCKEDYYTEYDFEEMPYKFCPNCGARMDEEVEENKQ